MSIGTSTPPYNASFVRPSSSITEEAAARCCVTSHWGDACSGLVIFTFGEKDLWYGRKGGKRNRFKPFQLEPLDTTGAGDSFRGAVAYGLAKGYSDEETVRFASAVAARVCLSMPHALNGPDLDEVLEFLSENPL